MCMVYMYDTVLVGFMNNNKFRMNFTGFGVGICKELLESVILYIGTENLWF